MAALETESGWSESLRQTNFESGFENLTLNEDFELELQALK